MTPLCVAATVGRRSTGDPMLDTIDTSGLVCGYRIDGEGQASELAWENAEAALDDEASVVWLHFNLADARARERIESFRQIPQAAKTLLLGRDSHMRIEVAGSGLAGVVGDLHHNDTQKVGRRGVRRTAALRRQPLPDLGTVASVAIDAEAAARGRCGAEGRPAGDDPHAFPAPRDRHVERPAGRAHQRRRRSRGGAAGRQARLSGAGARPHPSHRRAPAPATWCRRRTR